MKRWRQSYSSLVPMGMVLQVHKTVELTILA